MERMGNLELYTFEEVKDELLGKIGTPERDEHERKVAEALQAYHIGKMIKEARLQQNLTQKELGNKLGVKRTQVSRLEKRCDSLSTLTKIFKALNVPLSLNVGGVRNVVLW